MTAKFTNGLARFQRGATFAEWLFIAFACTLLLLFTIRLYSPVLTDYKLDKAIKATIANADPNKATRSKILAEIQSNLNSANADLLAVDVLSVSANRSGIFISKKYQRQFGFFGPIDMVIKFDKNYDSAKLKN